MNFKSTLTGHLIVLLQYKTATMLISFRTNIKFLNIKPIKAMHDLVSHYLSDFTCYSKPLTGLLQTLHSPPFSQHRRHALTVGFLHWLFPLARILSSHTANSLTFSNQVFSQISVTSQWSLTWSVQWKLQFIP